MRTIKFRVIEKHKDGTYDIWDDSCGDWKLEFRDGSKPRLMMFDYDHGFWNGTDNNIEIYEFTGLHDKNGTEIYEGDIVEINSSYLDKPIRSEVVYGGEEYPAFDLPNYDADTMNGFSAIYFGDDETMDVIGNIYEHPELLEKEATHED